MSAMLQVRDLVAGYGQAVVLEHVDFTVKRGEVVAVVGANGAGKTTLLNTIAGVLQPFSGSITFDGTDITKTPAHALPKQGLVLVPEGGRLFPFMTVEENLEMGGFSRRKASDFADSLEEVMQLFPILKQRRAQFAGHLSGGERQMCAVARAVMSRPKMIMLDEPSVGLSPKMVGEVFSLVENLARTKGITVVLVEQNVQEALEVSDRAYVLDHGRFVRNGSSAELGGDPAIQAAYMGL
ncbi:ABC transporter ATP-binding protein [Tianweitania sediminis]|uniref:ABC transporter ATP-binding protein n=1 Tax=Tianweitania sediminis TaxID=1502156 RepID=A0A8J7R3F2_9HYPH|nr:ABC transporter ATP-binding protein [Tianweitania sediminis]MBP0441155.1 ABC transporter ATP-binding protein [Tianweitania sediminis]